MDEGHSLICGTTMSGKTTLAKILCAKYRNAGIATLVLDPFKDPEWQASWITADPDEYLAVIRDPENRQCALFMDESGETVGHYAPAMRWPATMGRHHGHKSNFITQAPQQLDPVIRAQCSQAFIFRINASAMKILADEFCQPSILKAGELEKGEFLYVARFAQPKRCKIDFVRKVIVPSGALLRQR